MRHVKIKQFILLLGLLLPTVWSGANSTISFDGYSHILIKEGIAQGAPKGSAIQASINGHMLTVAFTENLGEVDIEITTSTGGYVQANSCLTPNGIQFIIPLAGDYIVTFTLPNGDEYYGEFTVTD
jgi:hypothetical protein